MLSNTTDPFSCFLAYFLLIHYQHSLIQRHDLRDRVHSLFLNTWTYLQNSQSSLLLGILLQFLSHYGESLLPPHFDPILSFLSSLLEPALLPTNDI